MKRVAARLGVRAPLRSYYSIGLGAQAVSPLELARAYSAFANGGYRFDTKRFGNRPRTVLSIEDRRGRPVDQRELMPRAAAKLRPQTAAWVNAALQDVVERGTGRLAAIPGRPVAGKTGTTENYGDAWFVGYTPQLVVAVWVGYRKELRPMLTEYEGEPVTGGTLPALIWKSFVERAHPKHAPEVEQFEPPSLAGYAAKLVVNQGGRIQLDNGNCDAAVEVAYFPGFGPKESADCAAD